MKTWILPARIAFSIAAYALAYILFAYSSVYHEFALLFKTQNRAFIIINIAAFVIIGLCYKRFEKAVFVICIIFASPSVLTHSKLFRSMSQSTVYVQYFSPHLIALLFFTVVVFLLAANRLERLDRQHEEMVSGGALEADVELITLNNIKMYSAFLAVALLSGLVLIALGYLATQIRVSWPIIIIMVVIGIVLALGCVLYLYRRWIKK
ncbi:hypothetical protein [Acetivibrio straminisolvens]|uniref:Uncharacterized protein n=1 Tax=Acetivibrio straminisolvens JCM 21531 TaxID=1294263 RepID=W4V8Y0_9FIRM|nr:hypothetical protein [Acetivibrio straminisolvens]GAE89662.1 hypothetical protein JCM21531_3210 [Acetivibrio straminisolvens JCM 21531]